MQRVQRLYELRTEHPWTAAVRVPGNIVALEGASYVKGQTVALKDVRDV